MTDAVGHLGHDVSTDVVGLLCVVSYIGILRTVYQGIGDTLMMSIIVGIGAVSAAASTPNWLFCCVVRAATSLGNDALWWRWQNRRKKSGRR
jgi:hypothetical protein